ncbi:hypothetical protein BFJ66_g766 [Fusarium oxysporum f. sp. cepae]|uniref:Uncharacterized protein n=1 Tax=Fusarium oxysporum f. sp. cepae TaxID=396571 RepID=A0A3L6P189_FUSOX|nr:hypothetical protein BFJ65_g3806 [Fusarium oxysporum f. sp. cepae]RKK62472.1 hypothetical protein BFJ66_g766 [Fusarium oxysporum f. sp. cepae]
MGKKNKNKNAEPPPGPMSSWRQHTGLHPSTSSGIESCRRIDNNAQTPNEDKLKRFLPV